LRAAVLLILFINVIPVPATLTPQNGASVATSTDESSGWKAQWGMQEIQLQGKRTVRFQETGSGRLSAFSGEVRWSAVSTWLADGGFRPLDTQRTVTTPEGKVLLVERKHFDQSKGTVRLERTRAGEAPEVRLVDVPEDTLAIEGLAGVLRFAGVSNPRTFSAHILSNEPKVYKVSFEWRAEEKVSTPAGDFDCYRVEMVPHLGLLNVVRPFLQKTNFWFTVAAPHNWIRYEGPESGPGTPAVVLSLTRRD
jgi:hypothetical protein